MVLSLTMLQALWGYNAQANQKLLAALAQVPARDLEAAASPSRGSLWRLVCHIYYTEEHFVRRCRGDAYQRQLLATLPALQGQWQSLHHDALDYLETATEADLTEIVAVELGSEQFQFARWELLLQAVTHSIQHRGELSILLTGLGFPLPNMDLIVYLAETHGIEWPWK